MDEGDREVIENYGDLYDVKVDMTIHFESGDVSLKNRDAMVTMFLMSMVYSQDMFNHVTTDSDEESIEKFKIKASMMSAVLIMVSRMQDNERIFLGNTKTMTDFMRIISETIINFGSTYKFDPQCIGDYIEIADNVMNQIDGIKSKEGTV